MKYSVKRGLKISGAYHTPGSSVDLKEKDKETERLLGLGVIGTYDQKAAKDYEDSQKPPPNFEDDFTEIKGIGPDLEFALKGIGIKNFEQLAAAPIDRLVNLPDITERNAKGFVSAANKKVKAKAKK